MFTSDIRGASENGKRSVGAQTRAAVERQLHQRLAALCELIIDDLVYLDTITLLTRNRVKPEVEEHLKETTTGEVKVGGTKAWHYAASVRIHQPSMATIAFVTKYLPRHIVSRCDLGVDLLTRDEDDAHTIQTELRHRGTQPRRGHRRKTRTYAGTDYWHFAKTWTTRNIAAYSDKVSKITGGPCAHFDLRMYSTLLCKGRGIYSAADLLKFDLVKSLENDFRLSAILWKLYPKRLDEHVHDVAQRMNELAQEDRKQCRRPLTMPPRVRLRGLIERCALYEVFDDDPDWASWADLVDVPVQIVLDEIDFLHNATVHIPASAFVQSRTLFI